MAKSKPKLNEGQMQAIAHAVADPRRFAILQSIARGGTVPCTSLREVHPISPATVSHHIKELDTAGLIDVEREGRCADLIFRRDVWDAYLAQLADI